MKSIESIMTGVLLTGLAVGGTFGARAAAQDGTGEIFTVPFSFIADGHEIRPGTYEIRRESSQFLLSIQDVKTGEKQLFSVRPEQRSAVPENGLLVFQQCGERKQLSEFHLRGTNLYSATIDSTPRESSELESCSKPGTVTIAAR